MPDSSTRPAHAREVRRRWGAGAAAVAALDRDARTPQLLGVPADAALLLRSLCVAIVGLGSVGAYLADLLARLGVASLLLVDRGTFKPESVLTHPIQPADIGRPKAHHAGQRAKAVSPLTRVRTFEGPVESLPLDTFAGASAVLMACDNHACELEVNQRCVHLGLPLIQAAVFPPTQSAQVRLFPNGDPDATCLACGYVDRDWEDLDRGTVYSCAGDGLETSAGPPTRALPQHCSTAASLAVGELMRLALGLTGGTSHVVDHCAFNQTTTTTALPRRSDCPVDHRRWGLVRHPGRLARATLRQLLAHAGPVALERVSLAVEGYRFALLGACKCQPHPALGRFLAPDAVAACPGCGLPLVPHPLYTYEAVPGPALADHLDRRLDDLGAAQPGSVLVEGETDAVLIAEAAR